MIGPFLQGFSGFDALEFHRVGIPPILVDVITPSKDNSNSCTAEDGRKVTFRGELGHITYALTSSLRYYLYRCLTSQFETGAPSR